MLFDSCSIDFYKDILNRCKKCVYKEKKNTSFFSRIYIYINKKQKNVYTLRTSGNDRSDSLRLVINQSRVIFVLIWMGE